MHERWICHPHIKSMGQFMFTTGGEECPVYVQYEKIRNGMK